MSAWTVNKKMIDVLMTEAIRARDPIYFTASDGESYKIDRDNVNEIGQALWNANYKSVNHRYNEDTKAPQYKYEMDSYHRKAVDVIKSCKCFDYQTCEFPEWEETVEKDILERIMHKAINRLPGYEEAPWGF